MDGDTIDVVFLRVPESEDFPEGIKYRAVYIRNNERLVGYDNAVHHGPGLRHHKHIRDRIVQYDFVDMWTLMSDFEEDMRKIRDGIMK